MFDRFYGNVWPLYAGSSSIWGEFLRKCLAVQREITEKFGQAVSIFLALFWYKSRF
jgi:hypothetical protein